MAFAQSSYDERIAEAMNSSDWFALDSIYSEAPKDSISEFLEVFSRCMIGNRFNRTDVSIPAFAELLNTQAQNLGIENLVSSAWMYAMDLGRVGAYAEATQMLTAVISAVKPHMEESSLALLEQFATLYSRLSNHNPYQIAFGEDATGVVPFRIEPVGPEDKQQVLLHLENSAINGKEADITFDTGAGINVITDSMAAQYGLVPLDVTFTTKGAGYETGRYAMARELKIGNITVSNVPFLVLTMTTHNAEADQHIKAFNITVGCELMLQLKDLTFDFQRQEITVPAEAPSKSGAKPNMYFSSGMNFIAKAVLQGTPVRMCIDAGDASYGWMGNHFFKKNKEYILQHSTLETVRGAGIGGVNTHESYSTPNLELTLGGSSVTIPALDVSADDAEPDAAYGDNLGLKSLLLFGKVRFNLVDFVLTTEPRQTSN